MDAETASSLRQLLVTGSVASLGTLHRGEPAVSMVPFVLVPEDAALLIHVSALATHTRDMVEHARVALLVMADLAPGVAPQALPRVSLQADARALPRDGDAYEHARARYLQRFPDAAVTFELADFSIFVLSPVSARLVAGFGRAHGLVGEALQNWLRGPR
jgi:putative heme iron utilization protein